MSSDGVSNPPATAAMPPSPRGDFGLLGGKDPVLTLPELHARYADDVYRFAS